MDRLFTPYVGPLVYSFAMILAAYLLATFFGSQMYRFRWRSLGCFRYRRISGGLKGVGHDVARNRPNRERKS